MKTVLITVLKIYKRVISPLLASSCRFYPSCADYSIKAIEQYGCVAGLRKVLARLLRCHPYHKGGYDPVTK